MSREEVEAMFTLGDLKKTRGKAFAPKFLNYSREIYVRKCFTLLAVCRLSVTAGGLGDRITV